MGTSALDYTIWGVPPGQAPGTGWVPLAISIPSTVGTGGTPIPIQSFGPWTAGVNCTATLTAALTSGNTAISMPAGPAVLVNSNNLLPPNLNIIAPGAILQLDPASVTQVNGYYNFFRTTGAGTGNNYIYGLTLDGNKANISSSVGQVGMIGIYVSSGSSNVVVDSCTIHDLYNQPSGESFGVQFSGGTTNCTIRNSRFYNIAGTGWNIGSSSFNPWNSFYHTVTGCLSYNNGWQGGSFYVMQFGVCTNNIVYGNAKRGLNFEWCDSILIQGNQVQGSAFEGIGTYGVCSNMHIVGNQLNGNNTSNIATQGEIGVSYGTYNGATGIATSATIADNMVIPRTGLPHLHVDSNYTGSTLRGSPVKIAVTGPDVDSWNVQINVAPLNSKRFPVGVSLKIPQLQSQIAVGSVSTWTTSNATLSTPGAVGQLGSNAQTVTVTTGNIGIVHAATGLIPAGSRVRVHYRVLITDQHASWQLQVSNGTTVAGYVIFSAAAAADVGTWQEGDFIALTGANASTLYFTNPVAATGTTAPVIDFVTVAQIEYLDSLSVGNTSTSVPASMTLAPSGTYMTPTSGTVTVVPTILDSHGNGLSGFAVTYVSSNTGVATVGSTTGVITYVGAGSATITGTVTGYTSVTATCVVTAYVPAASSMSAVSPSAFTVNVGATEQLTGAVVLDQHGFPITADTATWSSGTTSVASVGSTTGLVTGVAAGSATITAAYSGVTSQTSGATVVTSGGGLNLTPNKPAGLRHVVAGRFFQAVNEDGWALSGTGSLADFSIVADSTNPTGNPNVGNIAFNTTLVQGEAPNCQQDRTPNIAAVLGTNAQFVYTSLLVKFSTNWKQSTAGMQKIYYLWTMDGGSEVDASTFMTFSNSSVANSWFPVYGVQAAVIKDYPSSGSNAAAYSYTSGKWYLYETYEVVNTPGSANGTIQMWITQDPGLPGAQTTQIINATNLQLVTNAGGIYKTQFVPVYGGDGGSPPNNQYMRLAWYDVWAST